ncbi:MAG: hypothetical protein ACTJHI_07275 [Psychrobacter sp.]|uniref:hypothetical protein n=1 Tax=unclassified Psychrobacter TaxID=196806 RepID=UPI0017889F13|nr:hypothetical protein [Psychrobacter sp. FME13]MBE0442115.1 hypothetical protein [Psychrobacter sp. FME13]
MSQTFHLCLANDTIVADAKQLNSTIDELKNIRIAVSLTVIHQPVMCLQFNYQISLPTPSLISQLNWPTWKVEQVGFADYLWEETCLECFIADDLINNNRIDKNTSPYIEINASPDGRYALYQFESYRKPVILPPTPLMLTDNKTRASIDWSGYIKPAITLTQTKTSEPSSKTSKPIDFEQSFNIPITQVSNNKYAMYGTPIEYIHPCVILWLNKTALYFAVSHPTPPDFHNCHYWSKGEI